MRLKIKLIVVCFVFIAHGCGIYSFTGANISPDIKTISVDLFYNDSDGGPPNMGQLFTDELRDYFQQNTSLNLVPDDGDLQFEGVITGYQLTPTAPTARQGNQLTDQSTLTRLTITVRVNYLNRSDEEQNFNSNFSFFADFDNTVNTINDVEDQLIEEIFDNIILDIFNASVANW